MKSRHVKCKLILRGAIIESTISTFFLPKILSQGSPLISLVNYLNLKTMNQPRMTQDNIRRKLAASPCIRIPLRNIFPAAYINNIDVRITKPHPKNGCQRGILTGAPSLSSISIGVAGGNSDMAREKVLSGSRMIFENTNKGAIASTITGIIALCASRISFTGYAQASFS
jgi:hypothetical protein